MGKLFDGITPELRQFIEQQHVFFVATAPRAENGHVNVSPKGLDSFRVLSGRRVAYLDLTGSGNETAAHVLENGRITIMFCAFSGPPRILRLYGRGGVVLPGSEEWPSLRAHFPELPGIRQIIVAEVERVQLSCGFGVPLMQQAAPRDTLVRWAAAKGEAGLREYREQNNVASIDGLPAPVTPQ
jgi:hypothetical protein